MSKTNARLSKHDAGLCKRAGEIMLVCAFADASPSKMRLCGLGAEAVNLARCWHAYRLLQGASRVGSRLSSQPWFQIRHYQRAWSLLVACRRSPSGAIEWSLLPGMEEDCRAAYRSAAEHGIDAAACREGCRELLRSWAIRHGSKMAL